MTRQSISSSLRRQSSETKPRTNLVLVSREPLLYLEFIKPNKQNVSEMMSEQLFDVICDLLLNRRTATWNLFVNYIINVFTDPAFIGSIFVCGPFHHHVLLFSFLGAVGLFRSDMLLIFYMVWPRFSCGTVCVCPQLPCRGNDMIIWIFPNVPCHAFCMWHWPIGKDLDLSFIWGHHHLSEYMDITRPTEYFIARYTVLTRPNKVETAVHGCNCWLSVWWTLSSRCPVIFT